MSSRPSSESFSQPSIGPWTKHRALAPDQPATPAQLLPCQALHAVPSTHLAARAPPRGTGQATKPPSSEAATSAGFSLPPPPASITKPIRMMTGRALKATVRMIGLCSDAEPLIPQRLRNSETRPFPAAATPSSTPPSAAAAIPALQPTASSPLNRRAPQKQPAPASQHQRGRRRRRRRTQR